MKKILIALLSVIFATLAACVPAADNKAYEVKDVYLKGGVYHENSYIVLYYDGGEIRNYEAKTQYFKIIIADNAPPTIKIDNSASATLYLPKNFEIKPTLNKN